MPITQSAKKALRQNIARNKRNEYKRIALKKTVKAYQKLVLAGKLDEAQTMLPKVFKAIDKTAKTHVIKKGKADRLKSRLSKKLATKK